MASSASTEQWIFTGGSFSSFTMSVFLIFPASSTLLPFSHSVARLDEAMALARDRDIDVAILDVNLSGNPVYPVAEVLAGRGVPFIFSTGYGEEGLPDAYRDCHMLQKPFQLENLEQALAGVAKSIA